MRSYAILPAATLFAILPAVALADSFTITNVTTKTANYDVRCNDGKDTWHTFSIAAGATKDTLSGDWNYSCGPEKYQLRVLDITGKDYNTDEFALAKYAKFALVYDGDSGTSVTDTGSLATFLNTSSSTINMDWHCIAGGNYKSSLNALPGTISYIDYEGCTSYNLAINTRMPNGAVVTLTRTIAPDTMYKLVPSNGSEDVVKIKGFPEP